MLRPRSIALLLAFATLVVFLPVSSHEFLNYDDTDYVTENPFVKNGLTLTDLRWAFTAFHSGNWHPLTWISHMLDCQLFDQNAGAHHFVNVLWHAANVALLFTLLLRWTSRLWPCAFIAALFAWHPLHVESVAWIAERKDVLSTFFALLALLSYTKYVQENNRRGYGFALLFFALGLLTKPMLVTLPFVLLLLDFWPLKRFPLAAFRLPLFSEKWPFFALTAISCVITFLAQKQGEAVASLQSVTLAYRLENAPVAVAGYLLKLFWPTNLCAIYPMHQLAIWQVLASVALLLLISFACWRWRGDKPYLLIGWLWFLGMLVPVIGLVQVGGQAMADRYTYLPSIGFFFAVAFLAADFVAKIQTPGFIRFGFAAAILIGCMLATEFQIRFWRDSETLFRHALAVTTENDTAHLNLGAALAAQDRADAALVEFHEVLRLTPGRYQLHNNIANILDDHGQPQAAAAEYREAIRLDPRIPFLHNSLGLTLLELGQTASAQSEFSEAARLDPNYAWPHVELAKILLSEGRDLDAVAELRIATRLGEDNYKILAVAAHYLSANENAAARDGEVALALALKANILANASQPVVFDVLGMACAETGDFTNAQVCAQNALELGTAAKLKGLEDIQHRLELYKLKQPWRESFRATNAPVKN